MRNMRIVVICAAGSLVIVLIIPGQLEVKQLDRYSMTKERLEEVARVLTNSDLMELQAPFFTEDIQGLLTQSLRPQLAGVQSEIRNEKTVLSVSPPRFLLISPGGDRDFCVDWRTIAIEDLANINAHTYRPTNGVFSVGDIVVRGKLQIEKATVSTP